jgi:hypothetical protein
MDWMENIATSLPELAASPTALIVATGQKPDISYAVHLGLTILMDKPLLVLAAPGTPIPRHLRRAADVVVEANLDTREGQLKMAAGMTRLRKIAGILAGPRCLTPADSSARVCV